MLRMVLPEIEANKLKNRPNMVPKLCAGHRADMYPAMPVATNKPVCKLLVNGKNKRIFESSLFIIFYSPERQASMLECISFNR
jgi:hypothetical protein